MTREDITKLFPDATDEQITNLLNQNNSEVAKEKNKANQYKEKANTADALQAKIDELEAGNLSELEKANMFFLHLPIIHTLLLLFAD
jgi:hypothetical protein